MRLTVEASSMSDRAVGRLPSRRYTTAALLSSLSDGPRATASAAAAPGPLASADSEVAAVRSNLRDSSSAFSYALRAPALHGHWAI